MLSQAWFSPACAYRTMFFRCISILVIACCAATALAADRVDYSQSVKPILKARCYACHGASKQEGGLRLDTGAAIRTGGDSGSGIVQGDAAKSLLLQRITSSDPAERMPLEGEPLNGSQIELVKLWITQGGESPADEAPQVDPRRHWAYQPPRPPELPHVAETEWVRGAIDRFILARLERDGIVPSPEADRATLMRRLYMDLVGLPPEPSDVEVFLHDDQPAAWERLVDDVLASPAFGERWGRHWLDVARYADSNGYEDDRMRPDAWRFRDWVVDAINTDLSFDQFTIWQLAGDLLPDATYEQKLATGFHRMTLSNDGGADSVEEEFRIIAVKDRVDTTGSVWLGLSVGCAKCHTHKYDPISQREYYQLFAFFNNATDANVPAPPLPRRYTEEYQRKLAALNARLDAIRTSLAEYEQTVLPERISRWQSTHSANEELLANVRKLLTVSAQKRSVKDQLKLAEMLAPIDPDYAGSKGDMLVNAGNNRPLPPSTVAQVVAVKERESHIHRRGNFLELGDPVRPGLPEFLPPLVPRDSTADRLDLARWIVDEKNPLTSRVAVNQIWRLLFGRGLVATPDEFGVTGNPPSHPELLDWLALEFIRQGWSRKAMIREMVTSSAYRQSSRSRADLLDKDPDNLLIARQARQRIEAECVRDLALDTAGILNRSMGGPSFQPPLPAGLEQIDELKNEQFLESSEGPDRYRRGVYIHAQRMLALPMLQTFDAADPNTTCARRDRSNTPLQALTLLNDPVFFEAAQALGRRIVAEGSKDCSQRVRWAFQLCLGRAPDEQEQSTLERLYHQQEQLCRSNLLAADEIVGSAPITAGVERTEVAAWVGVARTLLNLDEFITRE